MNATIADIGLSRIGRREAQCKQAINNWVMAASSGRQRLGGSYYYDYQRVGGTIVSRDDAVKGDIIQLSNPADRNGYYYPMHTAVVVGHAKGSDTFDVVDANWSLTDDEIVRRHQWNPYATAAGRRLEVTIWRLGTVDPSDPNPNTPGASPTGTPGVQTGGVPGANGTHFVYFIGSDGMLRTDHWTGSTWQRDNFGLGVKAGTRPGAYVGPNSAPFAYFVGQDDSLHAVHWTGSAWQHDNLGPADAVSPSAYAAPNDQHFVYYVASDHLLHVAHWTGTKWQDDNLGQAIAAGTSPSAYVSGGQFHFVYFVGRDNRLYTAHWTGSAWQLDNLGAADAVSPSAYAAPNDQHFVYYVASDHLLHVAHWTGTKWQDDNLGQAIASGTGLASHPA